MSSSDSPNTPNGQRKLIKTFMLDHERDADLIAWLNEKGPEQVHFTMTVLQALYAAMRSEQAQSYLPPEPQPDPSSPEAVLRRFLPLRNCLRLCGFWPAPEDLEGRDEATVRSEIVSQISHLSLKALLSLVYIASIFTLARLKGISYE